VSHYLDDSDLSGAVVLVVHAHPDDEVFATGAATIAAQRAGASVHLRLFTGGEGRGSALTPAGLEEARRRKEERLAAAATLLGIDTWGYLTEPGRWADTPHAPDQTIASADPSEVVEPVVEAIETMRPDMLLTVGADGLTGHPDHIACHDAVVRSLSMTSHPPRTALGAVLDQRAVEAGCYSARAITGRPIGSGRVTGVVLSADTVTVTGPPETEARRRQALDAYVPGLGTSDITDLDTDDVGSGDSVLLRFVLDAAGWHRDRFKQVAR
jgi:LmbE family N-acetylglucosaminyl deacetylase